MTRIVSAAFAAILLVASAAALSACNTVAGAGADVSTAGHAVTNAADSDKH
jgi:predicted small secreted protein